VGLVFVVVPGGFIVVLSALYSAAAGLAGLVGLAAASRWQLRASCARPGNASFENPSRVARSSFGPRGAVAQGRRPPGKQRSWVEWAPKLVL